MTMLAIIALILAGFPALMYFRNAKVFRRPRFQLSGEPPRISVLIPARNEESGIATALEVILKIAGVELEVIVLDDHSTDRTAEIVKSFAPRVRLESAPPLPEGWCGKQFACHTLASLATRENLCFLDADVRLEPTALLRMHGFLQSSGAKLVSGFPRQETGTLVEKLVVTLIQWLLLSYLPLDRMRKSLQVGLGAGCGQWFQTTKTAYTQSGGHAAIKGSLHDGIQLPRAYRRAGLMTDLCDASDEARCRMYRSAGQVWNGFAKNAGEGMGSPKAIGIWTVLLAGGHLLPFVMFAFFGFSDDWRFALGAWLAIAFSLAPRLHSAYRLKQSLIGAILHPVGILALLGIQWYALIRRTFSKPVGWKGRQMA